MRLAFSSLFDTPQNNFRIFLDGKIIWGEEVREFDTLISNLRKFLKTENGISNDCLLTRFFDILIKTLLWTKNDGKKIKGSPICAAVQHNPSRNQG